MSYFIMFSFRVQSVNLDAVAGSDYTEVDTTVTFQTFESEKTVTVLIENDGIIENDEQFLLRLSTTDSQVRINDDEMVITIQDNDGMRYMWAGTDSCCGIGLVLFSRFCFVSERKVNKSPWLLVDHLNANRDYYSLSNTRETIYYPGQAPSYFWR